MHSDGSFIPGRDHESLNEDSSEGSIAKMYTITMKRLWDTGNLISGVHHLGADEHTPEIRLFFVLDSRDMLHFARQSRLATPGSWPSTILESFC